MIMDRLERFRCYQRSVPELWDAVRFAERVQKEQLPPGKYPVGKGFAFVQEGNTRSFEEADFEVHRNYLDVQILLNGSEMWEYADRADLAVKTPYDLEINAGNIFSDEIIGSISKGLSEEETAQIMVDAYW